MAGAWWSEDEPLHLLRTAVNPARFGYFRDVLIPRLGMNPVSQRALDVGCGGGLLAEEFARLGFRVTGIDPSVPSIHTARAHAARIGLDITYSVAAGEALPFTDGAFDIVYCCDVLEHVSDVNTVIAEIARVLRSGGVFFYDTINRTWWSRLVTIKCLQEWKWSRLLPPDLHDWNRFITPQELQTLMSRHRLENREIAGMSPRGTPIQLIHAVRQFKRGVIGLRALGSRLTLTVSRDTSISYLGYGVKRSGG